jgi:hypothetical protein
MNIIKNYISSLKIYNLKKQFLQQFLQLHQVNKRKLETTNSDRNLQGNFIIIRNFKKLKQFLQQ